MNIINFVAFITSFLSVIGSDTKKSTTLEPTKKKDNNSRTHKKRNQHLHHLNTQKRNQFLIQKRNQFLILWNILWIIVGKFVVFMFLLNCKQNHIRQKCDICCPQTP